MSVRLSVAIPVYNFANFLPETLDTIVAQENISEVEILIIDGASTDNTASVVQNYKRFFQNIKYIRLPERGGIDRDMAQSVKYSSGDYCWLFGGDDLMQPGAITKVLQHIKTQEDLYLTRHFEWVDDVGEWVPWPTLSVEGEPVFQLSNEIERHRSILWFYWRVNC